MRLVILPLIALAAAATPALANEARVEARGGVIWDGGVTEDVWGIAAGYDWDLGEKTFVGLEVSGDKIGVSGRGASLAFPCRWLCARSQLRWMLLPRIDIRSRRLYKMVRSLFHPHTGHGRMYPHRSFQWRCLSIRWHCLS